MQRNYFARSFRTLALATGSVLLLCSAVTAAPVTGGTMTVILNPGTVTALVSIARSKPTALRRLSFQEGHLVLPFCVRSSFKRLSVATEPTGFQPVVV